MGFLNKKLNNLNKMRRPSVLEQFLEKRGVKTLPTKQFGATLFEDDEPIDLDYQD